MLRVRSGRTEPIARFPNRSPLSRLSRAVLRRSRAGHHYAPIENLEHVDVALIDRARHEIDMAAYVLTDWPILQARPFDREALWAQTQRADRMKPVTSCLASWRTAVQPA